MKKTAIAVSLATLLCANAQADTVLGLYLGAQIWNVQTEGSIGELNQEVTFDFEDQQQGHYFVALEHPIPLVPNIKISSTVLDTTGKTILEQEFNFGGIVYPVEAPVSTDINLSYVDYTLYYEIFDNDLLSFDLGLTVRDFDFDATATVQEPINLSSSLSETGAFPLLYANTIIGLPFTGLNLFAEANFISYDDQTIYDYQVGVSYELLDNLAIDLDLSLGYRSVTVELNDVANIYTNLTYSGVFAGAIVHF